MIEFGAYYFGTKYVYESELNGGDVMKVFYLVIFATSNLKEGGSHLSHIAMGIGAAKSIVKILKTVMILGYCKNDIESLHNR